jgi:hypothetical protein
VFFTLCVIPACPESFLGKDPTSESGRNLDLEFVIKKISKIRVALCSLPFFVFSLSCSSLPLSSEKSLSFQGPLSYCGLLYVPAVTRADAPPKPYLGIYLATKKWEGPVTDCTDGNFIQAAGVISGSPADEAGIREEDIILSVNGVPTCRYQGSIITSFKKMIEHQEIGSSVIMEVMRGGEKLSLSATVREAPTHNQQEALHPDIGVCNAPSLLENALRDRSGIAVFDSVIDGLFQRTNTVHNPGWSYEKESNPLQLKETTYLMRHPLASGAVAKEMTLQLVSPLHERNWGLEETVRKAAGLIDVDLPHSEPPEEITFPGLLRTMEETKRRVEHSLSRLRPEEKALLQEKALNPWDDDRWNTVLELSMKFDRRELLSAFSPLLFFLTRDNLSFLKEDLIKRFGHNKGPILFEAMTPIGKVIVGGPGSNVYTEDAALILDLGGDDLYLNNAGGTRPGMPLALVIDWEGNDRYITKESFSQGAGVLGGGFLIDLAGNDVFVSLDGSQGAGFFGMGFLYHGGGNSVYDARSFSQGTGQMGIGLLLGREGNDLYLCSHHGQGLGLFGGAGILIDKAGDDYYRMGGSEPDFRDPSRSTVSMGQGFGEGIRPEKVKYGVPGGIGMLIDEGGADTYIADYFAQGSSYYYGVGILNDMAGNDRYISGRYAQGAGIHSSVGVFIDQAGDDFYYASFGVAQGMGHDYGVGYFEDSQGDDSYWGGTLVQGATTGGSLGVFIDGGGKDLYQCRDRGQGFAAEADSIAIMMTPGPAGELKTPDQGKLSVRLGLKYSDND